MPQCVLVCCIALWLTLSACNSRTPVPTESLDPNASPVAFGQIQPIIEQRCTVCHSINPSRPGWGSPAGQTNLMTPAQIKNFATRIKVRAIQRRDMPYQNVTNMTDDERTLLGQWIEQGAIIPNE